MGMGLRDDCKVKPLTMKWTWGEEERRLEKIEEFKGAQWERTLEQADWRDWIRNTAFVIDL